MLKLVTILYVALALHWGLPASAADIKLLGTNDAGNSVISIEGDFVAGDLELFATAIQNTDAAIVTLSSDGGNLQTGLDIGGHIRMRGFSTVVPDGKECHSACALAWLGGTSRYVGTDSQVTFHAAYILSDGEALETGLGNALVGAYATKIGLKESAVIFLTSAPPSGFNELTEYWAEQTGISAIFGSTSNLLLLQSAGQVAEATEEEISDETLDEIIAHANSGDVTAQFYLGLLFHQGKRVERDIQRAIFFYTMAANAGNNKAQYNLGLIYMNGDGVEEDIAKAIDLFRRSAEQGNPKAQYRLARFYLAGQGIEKDETEAARLFTLAASQGEVNAQHMLGLTYLYGWGVEENEKQSFEWFLRAAEQGLPEAQYQVGHAFEEARGTTLDYDAAFSWMTKAANNNYTRAQVTLSWMYRDGIGVMPDASAAVKWMSAAALAGDAFANYALALDFDEGYGVTKSGKLAAKYILIFLESDHEKRVEWILKAGPFVSPETVYHLQGALAERGLYRGALDGVWGRGTVMAIKTFADN